MNHRIPKRLPPILNQLLREPYFPNQLPCLINLSDMLFSVAVAGKQNGAGERLAGLQQLCGVGTTIYSVAVGQQGYIV